MENEKLHTYYVRAILKAKAATAAWDTLRIESNQYLSGKLPASVPLHYARGNTLPPRIYSRPGRIDIQPRSQEPTDKEIGFGKMCEALYAAIADRRHYFRINKRIVYAADAGGTQVVRVALDKTHMPTLQYWPMDEFFVDPHCKGDLGKARWVAFKSRRSLADVKKEWKDGDESYNKEFPAEVATEQEDKAEQDREKWVDLYEVWSKDDGLVVYSPQHTTSLARHMKNKWPLSFATDGFPVVLLSYADDPATLYTHSDYHILKPHYDDLNNFVTLLKEQAQLNAAQKLIGDSALDTEQRESLLSPNESEFIPVDGFTPSSLPVAKMDFGPLNPSLMQFIDTLKGIINESSGMDEAARGGGSVRKETATKTAITDIWSQIRLGSKRNVIEEVYLPEVAYQTLHIAHQTMDKDRVEALVGKELSKHWERISPDDFRDKYRITVAEGSTQSRDDAAERESATSLFGIAFGPLLQLGAMEKGLKLLEDVVRSFKGSEWEQYMVTYEEVVKIEQGRQASEAQAQAPQELPPEQARPPMEEQQMPPELQAIFGEGGPPASFGMESEV